MKSEPLRGKMEFVHDDEPFLFNENDLKSAVDGLIQFHEDRIEETIFVLKEAYNKMGIKDPKFVRDQVRIIEQHYESIMAIEHWLEDVIDKQKHL